jgi:integrase/recombinase XerD
VTDKRPIPYVSLYQPEQRGGRWTLGYTLGKRRVEHLGLEASKARKRARIVSEVIDSYKSRLLTLDEALRKLGAHRSIGHYLDAFQRQIGGSDLHKQVVNGAVRNFVKLADIERPDQITQAAADRVIKALEEQGKAPRTINYWLQKARQFCKWLKKQGVLADNPLADVRGVGGGTQRPRRPATPEDVAKLCRAALANGPSRNGKVSGETRRLLYLTAFATGLRYGELRRAMSPWLKDGPPRIEMPAGSTKNSKGVTIPIPTWLVIELAEATVDRYLCVPAGLRDGPLFPDAPKQITKAMAEDMKAAGIPPQTDAGHLDFHSLRHGFVTQLARSGVDIKTLQKLARHSTAVLTLNVYTHVGELEERARAVEVGVPHPEGGSS